MLLRKLADQCGLTAELDAALPHPGPSPQLSRGMVVEPIAIAIAGVVEHGAIGRGKSPP